MVTFFAFLCFCFTFLLLIFLELNYLKKSKASQKNIHSNSTTKYLQLKPLPVMPLLTLMAQSILSHGLSVSHALKSIGKLHDVAVFQFWKIRFVIINNFELGKELFTNPVFCGKQSTEAFMMFSKGSHGLINSDGASWKIQKKFIKHNLIKFGFGTKSMETFIQTEIDHLIQNWCSHNGARFSPNQSFYLPVLNSIWTILTGDRASTNDAKLVELVYRVYTGLRRLAGLPDAFLVSLRVTLATARKLVHWTPFFRGANLFFNSVDDLHLHFEKTIASRKERLNLDEMPSNLVDAYLKEIHLTTDPQSEFFGNKGELNLLGMMTEFFIAGGTTTANSLSWAMLHLIRNPDIQEKIQQELDSVMGDHRCPSLYDRAKCPYTEAFILEVLRFNPIAALSLPHATTENTNIREYYIEKCSLLFLNIHNMQHDPKTWKDPETFQPQRFLSEDGKSVVGQEGISAFSLGPRRCVGEPMARDSLFLFISTICHRFNLRPDPLLKGVRPKLHEMLSIECVPATYYLIAVDRLASKKDTE